MSAATPGRRLGRYHLVEPLGGGPCGEVYRAKVVGVAGMERQLAVKRFHPQVLATPGVSARLSQAARTYGGLDHPRLARLAELGVASGETFTAVEWVNGLDLARLLTMATETNAPLPAGASLSLIAAAARAIGYAHGRGVCHLGLAPTNIIATGDGDIKVTDVGILACRLPPRPASDPSLVARTAYLAPEQLIGEPVSAATDVFVLGVMAYELINGSRPFGGASTHELEQAVLSGRPAPLELPRPVARVIDRCLARSPFERFPDARALADALDAALRLSPLAGGKRDIAERVAGALEHIARLNEQQLSGALSFAVPTPPLRPGTGNLPLPPPKRTGAAPALVRPRPASVAPPTAPLSHTLRGSPPTMPRAPTELTGEPTIVRVDEPDESNLSVGDDTVPRIAPMWPPTEPVQTLKAPPPPPSMTLRMGNVPPPVPAPPPRPPTAPASFDPSQPLFTFPDGSPMGRPPEAPLGAPLRLPTGVPVEPAPGGPPLPMVPMGGPPMPPPHLAPPAPPRSRRTLMIVALAVVLIGITAGVAFIVQRGLRSDGAAAPAPAVAAVDAGAAPADAAARVAVAAVDAGAGRAVVPDAATAVALVAVDAAAPDEPAADAAAAVAVTVDAGTAEPVRPPDAPSDKLVIRSKPAGATVFLDGAEQGKTPVTVAGSADTHGLAVVLPGYDLYRAEVPGRGSHDIELVAVTPPEGPAGIKVRCKDDDRYYVYLDGKATGQLCPTERLGVEKGDHVIEVYDLVSETEREFPAKVKETRVSVRVRVDGD